MVQQALAFFVDSVDEFHKKMLAENITVKKEPLKQPWGGYKAEYNTPDGHTLSVVEHKGGFGGEHPFGQAPAAACPTEARLTYFVYYCTEPKKAAQWFSDTFGWEKECGDYEEWAGVSHPKTPQVHIAFYRDGDVSDAKFSKENLETAGGVALFVDDIHQYHATIADKMTVVQAPTKQFWGGVQGLYSSPYHNHISIIECKGHATEYEVKKPEIVQVPKKIFLGIRETHQLKELKEFFARTLPKVFGFVAEHKMQINGPPAGIFFCVTGEKENTTLDLAAAVAVEEATKETEEIKAYTVGGGKAVHVIHKGSYDTLSCSWGVAKQFVADNKLEHNGATWEEYANDPHHVAVEDLITEIYIPVK